MLFQGQEGQKYQQSNAREKKIVQTDVQNKVAQKNQDEPFECVGLSECAGLRTSTIALTDTQARRTITPH